MFGSLARGTSAGFWSWAAKTTFEAGYKVPFINWARVAGARGAGAGVAAPVAGD